MGETYTPQTFLQLFYTKEPDLDAPKIKLAEGLIEALGLDPNKNLDLIPGAQGFIRLASSEGIEAIPGLPSDGDGRLETLLNDMSNHADKAHLWTTFDHIEHATDMKVPQEIKDAIYDYYTTPLPAKWDTAFVVDEEIPRVTAEFYLAALAEGKEYDPRDPNMEEAKGILDALDLPYASAYLTGALILADRIDATPGQPFEINDDGIPHIEGAKALGIIASGASDIWDVSTTALRIYRETDLYPDDKTISTLIDYYTGIEQTIELQYEETEDLKSDGASLMKP